MYEKVICRLAFLEGELEIGKGDKEVVIPLIAGQIKFKEKLMTVFDMQKSIKFRRTEKKEREMSIFEPVSITLPLDEINYNKEQNEVK